VETLPRDVILCGTTEARVLSVRKVSQLRSTLGPTSTGTSVTCDFTGVSTALTGEGGPEPEVTCDDVMRDVTLNPGRCSRVSLTYD